MNLSSLCTAIRSQLYFSQVTAWSDSIRNSDNVELRSTGRFKYPNLTTSNNWMRKPRLDIFYRIKPHDYSSIAYFKSNPIVHNFPHVIINDNYCLSVSLKSLPRIQNIPMMNVNKTPLGGSRNKSFTRENPLDDCTCENEDHQPTALSKPNYVSTDDENDDIFFYNDTESNSNCLTYREKQVIKYKRLIKKRDNGKRKSDAIYTSEKNQLQNLPEFGSINSIQPPLYQAVSTSIPDSVQTRSVEMISIGTQTKFSKKTYCEDCGNVMSVLCINCDSRISNKERENIPDIMDKQSSIIDKAELLLNAIQRTPKHKKSSVENRFIKCSKNLNTLSENDCILCKRQKTQHTYQNKSTSSESNNNNPIEIFSKYDVNNSDCDCNFTSRIDHTPLILNEKFYPSPKTQFKTPTNKTSYSSITSNLTKLAANSESSMDISNAYTPISFLTSNKTMPKMNLTQLFCNSSVDLNSMYDTSTLPITITHSNHISDSDSIMQKSNSAPSLPATPSSCLSPRFIKQSVAYNFRRVRHLSERSDRSIGSDEQLSDDDFDLLGYGPYNPNFDSSVNKNRPFFKSSKPLLGNLEESLLQKRIVPNKYVSGFKILLGASGVFCPPQVTISADSYFYELKGQTMNTPYLVRIFYFIII